MIAPTVKNKETALVAPKLQKKLGINCRFLSATTTGVERYAHNVLQSLIPIAFKSGWSMTCFVPVGVELPEYLQEHVKIVRTNISDSKFGKHLWEQFTLPRLASQEAVDTLLNLTNTAPVLCSDNVVTLHDVAWLTNSSSVSLPFQLLYKVLIPRMCRTAKHIVTVSEQSADDIRRLLHVPASKLSILHEGIGLRIHEPNNDAAVLARFDLKQPYFLHVGTLNDRKNLNRLVEAHKNLTAKLGGDTPDLVLAGGKTSHLKDSVDCGNAKFLGYVSDEELSAIYRNALSYVTVSLSEGFNLPILEAMAHGTPVVASSIPVHKEVAGSNAIFCDPLDVKSIEDALFLVTTNEPERLRLKVAGEQWCGNFSWSSHAEGLLNLLDLLEAKDGR